MSGVNRQWLISKLPTGRLSVDDFRLHEQPVPEPATGEVLVRNRTLSVDAGYRGWLQGASYAFSLKPGQVLPATALGEIVASNVAGISAGDLVAGAFGWQEYAIATEAQLERRDPGLPLEATLALYGGIFGRSGSMIAHYGMVDIAQPLPGETVVVSAAAGFVGVMAAQIAKLAGCRVVGTAGGAEKARWLLDEIGLDAVVDRKAGDVAGQLAAACPNGIDVFFDNTGGEMLEAVIEKMNVHARIACCGAVSEYDGAAPAAGPRGVPQSLIIKRLRMQGFLTMDCPDRPLAQQRLLQWYRSGLIKLPMQIYEGLETAPGAFVDLLAGVNCGKVMVRV